MILLNLMINARKKIKFSCSEKFSMRKKKSWRKYEIIKPSAVIESDLESESIDHEDYAFINEYQNYAKFLQNLNFREIEEIEKNFVPKKIIEKKELLPIKLRDGSIHVPIVTEIDSLNESDNDTINDSINDHLQTPLTSDFIVNADPAAENAQESIQPDDKIQPKKIKLAQIKEEIAALATEIMQDPEGNINNLEKLRNFTKSKDLNCVKLSLLTLLMVFKDIIPGYRIKMETGEQQVNLSKDVKKLKGFESLLLSNYQEYLKELEGKYKNYFRK